MTTLLFSSSSTLLFSSSLTLLFCDDRRYCLSGRTNCSRSGSLSTFTRFLRFCCDASPSTLTATSLPAGAPNNEPGILAPLLAQGPTEQVCYPREALPAPRSLPRVQEPRVRVLSPREAQPESLPPEARVREPPGLAHTSEEASPMPPQPVQLGQEPPEQACSPLDVAAAGAAPVGAAGADPLVEGGGAGYGGA